MVTTPAAVEPYDHGLLDVGDGHRVHWETCGKPALYVHGGPGAGCSPGARRTFDPRRYRGVFFDQRGCGRSAPHAATDPAADLVANTTAHLVADMERLREHLGVERWLLFGGSWGATLALAYAQRHPERVTEIVLCSVTTSRRSEIDWLYGGVGRFLPEEHRRFREAVPEADRDGGLLAGYARLLGDPDPAVRARAAEAWLAWEDAVVAHEPHARPAHYGGRPADAGVALARICAHYFSRGAWLPEGALIDGARRLAGIPGAVVHGRLDMGCPPATAWELAQAWPGCDLRIVDDSGHAGNPEFARELAAALDRFAGR